MYEADPELIWWNGAIVPWDAARVHVTSETALRGLNVFEGIRAYWREAEQRHAVIWLEAHLERLVASAGLLEIPADGIAEQVRRGIGELLDAVGLRQDLYLRPTLYVESGRYTAEPDSIATGVFIACHPVGPRPEAPLSCMVSRWRRVPETSLPTLAKTGASYSAFRLARLEAHRRGADEAILLNTRDLVAETPGAAVFVRRRDSLLTPPLHDGILDGFTRRTVMQLAPQECGVTVLEQSVTRSELYDADEVFICGTLDEIRIVGSIDGHEPRCRTAPMGRAIRDAYLAMCAGRRPPLGEGFAELLP